MKKLFTFKYIKNNKKQRGFTLIELVLYAGLLSILVGVMGTIFAQIVDVQLESEATSSVDQDLRYIQSKMIYDFQSRGSVVIEDPLSPGESPQSLRININNDTSDTTYAVDSNGNLVLTDGQGSSYLNGFNTRISNFSATRIGAGGDNDTVRVSFTITSRIQEASGYETRNFQSTFAGHNEN